MAKTESVDKRRRRPKLWFALLGIVLSAGLAYALVAWRRALMPEAQMTIWPDEMSVYQVGEDPSREWGETPVGDVEKDGLAHHAGDTLGACLRDEVVDCV